MGFQTLSRVSSRVSERESGSGLCLYFEHNIITIICTSLSFTWQKLSRPLGDEAFL